MMMMMIIIIVTLSITSSNLFACIRLKSSSMLIPVNRSLAVCHDVVDWWVLLHRPQMNDTDVASTAQRRRVAAGVNGLYTAVFYNPHRWSILYFNLRLFTIINYWRVSANQLRSKQPYLATNIMQTRARGWQLTSVTTSLAIHRFTNATIRTFLCH